jgi:RNA polymerase sigma-70 factor, ECF subfamily
MDLSDREQFDAAYRDYAPLCLHIARKVLGDPAAAEEVVQDLFLGLWRNPRAFDPARGSLKSYVAMTARSRSIDRWRGRAAERSARERLETEARVLRRDRAEGSDQHVLEAERRGQLLTAVGKLPSEQRDAVLLAFAGGLTAREIADGAGLPLGTAKSRIRLGLTRARAHMSEAA